MSKEEKTITIKLPERSQKRFGPMLFIFIIIITVICILAFCGSLVFVGLSTGTTGNNLVNDFH